MVSIPSTKKKLSLRINTKFTLIISAISFIVLLINLFLFLNINVLINRMDAIYDSNIRLNALSETIDLVRENMTGYLNTKSADSMEDYYRYKQELSTALESLNQETSADKYKLAEKNIRNMALSYISITDKAIDAKRGRKVDQYTICYDDSEILHKYLSSYIFTLNNERFKENAEVYELLSGRLRILEIISVVIFGLVAVTGIILVSIICNSITTPLVNLAAAAKEVSQGNYDVEITRKGVDDEIGVVQDAFNTMIGGIQDNIVTLRKNMEMEQEMKEKELMMEAHLKDAKLKYLQAQINPHFLFNTLNAGAQLAMMEGADRAYEYMQQVATFFRYNIKKNNDVVSLKEEIALVDTYVYILNVRFSGEIGYEKDIDEALLNAKIPSMSLQPIVENSVNYGIRDISWDGLIKLKVYKKDDQICISIKDNGSGISKEKIDEIMQRSVTASDGDSDSNGIGLDNVMSRLELMYGKSHVIDIISEGKDKGTEVILYIPYEEV